MTTGGEGFKLSPLQQNQNIDRTLSRIVRKSICDVMAAVKMSGGPFHRPPAVFTEIGAITPEDAGRTVRVMGFVVDLQNESGFIISDDTGRITVLAENSLSLQSFIRVFGSIALSPEGQPIIRAEIVQDLAELDKHLFKRTIKLVQSTPSGRKI